MDRLKGALARRKAEPAPEPVIPDLPEEAGRRAFEGLKARAPAPAIERRARRAVSQARDALASERQAIAARMAQALGLQAPELLPAAQAIARPEDQGRVPLLFVSSSMPIAILRTYAAQLEKAGGVMAFRGMPGGLTHVAPMAQLSAQILRRDPGCEGPACAMRVVQIIVDPLVYRQHGVVRVPALTMVPGDPTRPYCERGGNAPRSAQLVYGDAALSGLLEEYSRLGGSMEVRDAQARLQSR